MRVLPCLPCLPELRPSAFAQGCRFLQQLVQDMNAQLTTFTSLEHYEAELGENITPMIADKFEALDEDSADILQVSELVGGDQEEKTTRALPENKKER